MSNSAARSCNRRLVLFTGVFCLLSFSIASWAAESGAQKSPDQAKSSTDAKVAQIQLYVSTSQREQSTAEQLERLQRDVAELREFRRELETRSKWPWVATAPWVALGTIGLLFVILWFVLKQRELSLDSKTFSELKEFFKTLAVQAPELSRNIDALNQKVGIAAAKVDDFWKTIAIARLAGKDPKS